MPSVPFQTYSSAELLTIRPSATNLLTQLPRPLCRKIKALKLTSCECRAGVSKQRNITTFVQHRLARPCIQAISTRILVPIPRAERKYQLSKLFLSNTRALCNKVDELGAVLRCTIADVAVITETWLSSGVPHQAVDIPAGLECMWHACEISISASGCLSYSARGCLQPSKGS